MKTDLDSLMQSRNLDAIWVTGPAMHNPIMTYMIGGGNITHADLVKKRGAEPLLFCHSIERGEAEKSGLTIKNLADYDFDALLSQAGGDFLGATAQRYRLMFNEAGLTSGRVGVYGRLDTGASLALFATLRRLMPDLEWVGEYGDSMFLQAMATKDEAELQRIRRIGAITTGVVGRIAEFLTSQKVVGDILILGDENPLTVGEVKKHINLWLAEGGADNPEGVIFAVGQRATVPHNTGEADDLICLGKTIVFDIFPCEAGGGYYYDLTRTWCLGYAPDDALALYEDVRDVKQTIMDEAKAGAFGPDLHKRACDLFEARGHPTVQSDPKTEAGYVHGLGHGLGLQIHARPYFGKEALEADRLAPGMVFTIEPCLYYPERGIAVRLEDTVWLRPDGQVEILTPYSLDFVLQMKYKGVKRSRTRKQAK